MIKIIAVSLLAAALGGCNAHISKSQNNGSEISAATAERHLDATHCEIFVDKIASAIGSHGSNTIMPYIKILKDRLDSEVAEVGIRSQSTHTYSGGLTEVQHWGNKVLLSRSPVGDYFAPEGGLMVASDFGLTSSEAVFYVKTVNGTIYWAKPAGGGNFKFDPNFGSDLLHRYSLQHNYGTGPDSAIPTQDREDMRYLNPQRCY